MANKDKRIVGQTNKVTTRILCWFKDYDLSVIYPDHIGETLPTHLYMYVNLTIEKSVKLLNVGDIIWDDRGNSFMLLEKDLNEVSSDITSKQKSLNNIH